MMMSPAAAASARRSTSKPASCGLGPVGIVLAQPDHHLHAGIAQVEGVGVSLAAVSDDGHRLSVQQGKVRVFS